MSEFLDAALMYASMGWRVFPLYPKSKNPATTHGFKDATTDGDQIESWWAKNPNYNVGIATGSGLCVIDVDDKPKNAVQGSDALRDWELEHGDIAETVTAISGTGGVHYYYDVGDAEIPSCASDKIFIDLRSEGGFIVAPPSIHPDTSEPYMWDVSPEDAPPTKVSPIEKACIDWIYKSRRGADKGGRRKKPKVKTVKEGEGRNSYLYEIGCSVRGQGADDAVVAAYLETLNDRTCKPPLSDGELSKIINSVCSKEPGLSEEAKQAKEKGGGKKARFKHNEVAKKLIDEQGACLIDGVTPAIRENGERYRMGWDAFDTAIINMHDDCTANNRRETKAYVQAKAPHRDQSPWNFIAFTNGVLDVETMEFRDWAEDDVISNVIPHRWNPDAKSDLLYKTLEKMACGDTATLMNLQEFIGICMMRSNTRMPFYPVLIGSGSNGKSSYIKLLKNVLGTENISALQPKEIGAHFMGAHIVGKLANLGDDIADAYLDGADCGIIKRISTGERIFTDVKGTTGFDFEPYCTMVFSCNAFPRCKDTTEGFLRRLFPIEFNAHFTANDADYDPMIATKLKTEETLEYACVIGIEGLRRAVAQNQPTPNRMSSEVKKSIAADSNTGLQWFNDDEITREDIIGKTKEEVYREYFAWCEKNGYARTALSSGTLAALIGTYWRLKCTKMEHRQFSTGRKTVRVFAEIVP